MDPYYGRGAYDYRYDLPPPDRKVPRSYDPYPPPEEYPRPAQRVYAAQPTAMSYPAPTSDRRVEIRYYDPQEGLPYPMPIRPTPAPVVAAAPSVQIQYPQLPRGSGSQFVEGQLYKVVDVQGPQVYRSGPPAPRADPLPYDYGYAPPPMSRGVPQGRPPYGYY